MQKDWILFVMITQISEIQQETVMDMLQEYKKRQLFQYELREIKKIYEQGRNFLVLCHSARFYVSVYIPHKCSSLMITGAGYQTCRTFAQYPTSSSF